MVGKIMNTIFMLIVAVLVFSAASIAGVRNDVKKETLAVEEAEAEKQAEAEKPKEITSPYQPYAGGMLELQMDYEVQLIGDDVIITVVTNLPDSYDLTAELSNIEDVKKQLGFENISASALTPEQMSSINELTYSRKEKNFVTSGVSEFTFKSPPPGQLDLKVTSPITKLQPTKVAELLGEKGENLTGSYVVYLEEVADKSINFNASFVVDGPDDIGNAEEPAGETP